MEMEEWNGWNGGIFQIPSQEKNWNGWKGSVEGRKPWKKIEAGNKTRHVLMSAITRHSGDTEVTLEHLVTETLL